MLVLANWKMNGDRQLVDTMFAELARTSFDNIAVGVALPNILLSYGKAQDPKFQLGAQTVGSYASGAYTGETSAAMLRDAEVDFVIIGHSERRGVFQETNQDIALKVKLALQDKLQVVLCVGESLEERNSGSAHKVVAEQLRTAFADLEDVDWGKIVIAYEPVWAIGTGQVPSEDDIAVMADHIICSLYEQDGLSAGQVPVLYGGSVNENNCADITSIAGISGVLVGGVSLKVTNFINLLGQIAQVAPRNT